VALLRALTEAAQTRLTAIAGGREDITRARYRAGAESERVEAWRAHLAQQPCGRRFVDVQTRSFESFNGELAWLLDRLRSRKMGEVAVVDLAPPENPYSVVRVVVPGLEAPPEAGCRPGRRAKGRERG